VAYGIVYLMIAWTAGQLALGRPGGNASAKGALAMLADGSVGRVLVWAIAAGLFVLVGWRLLEAAAGHRDRDGGERARARLMSLGKAVLYGAIGVSAVKVATGNKLSQGGPKTLTARLMDAPAGPWIVAGVGLAIVGYGAAMVWRGWTDRFLKHLDGQGRTGDTGRAYRWFGRVGYVAKGIAFGIVGALFVYAAITHEPRKSGGLDRALRKVLDEPYGPLLLLLIAVGIGCYGLFCFAWARHRSRTSVS
jgi:membrane protein implicated in regulation of membrane protease activity